MPVFSVTGKLFFFCHVPRCGGTAIENYLRDRFGPLGFLNRGHYSKLSEAQRWSVTSPQHIEIEAMNYLLPPSFFAQRFAIVRHPVDRIVSVFRYQRDVEQTLPADTVFDAWLEALPEVMAGLPHYLDNHLRPMTELVYRAAKVFQLEAGLTPVIDWLDKHAGDKRGPREIKVTNSYEQRLTAVGAKPSAAIVVTPDARVRIGQIYASDFERFDYDLA